MADDRETNRPAALIAAVASRGDREAFAGLFEFYAPRIKGFFVRRGMTSDAAEELAQETMVTVWRKAAMFDPRRASASTWIFTIARNLRIDGLRRDRLVPADAHYDVLAADAPEQPDETLAAAEREEKIRFALKELPSEQMAVVRLSYYEDKPHADIARILGIPLGTVKSRLRLAMARLREQLEGLS